MLEPSSLPDADRRVVPQDGATPETIAQRYPTATLADVYAVVAYYLRHREDIEAYLEEREQRAQEVRQRLESQQGPLSDLRNRILARQHTTRE